MAIAVRCLWLSNGVVVVSDGCVVVVVVVDVDVDVVLMPLVRKQFSPKGFGKGNQGL